MCLHVSAPRGHMWEAGVCCPASYTGRGQRRSWTSRLGQAPAYRIKVGYWQGSHWALALLTSPASGPPARQDPFLSLLWILRRKPWEAGSHGVTAVQQAVPFG